MFMVIKQMMVVPAIVMALCTVTSCNKQAALSSCKKDSDCRVDATGAETNGVCFMGKCEECAQDTDCTDLKHCVDNRCLSACQADADCGPDKHCENAYCMADCSNNASCPGDQSCSQGRCVTEGEVGGNDALYGECTAISPIHFDFDRYTIKPEYQASIDRLAQCLESNPSYFLTVAGHADPRGTPSYNLALGEKRAYEVAQRLTRSKGIASQRVKTQSFGDQRPLNTESNEHAWQQNRRAEFVFGTN